jgi:hypothetical protein
MNTATLASNPNNLELNKGDQFIIGLDISGSMGQSDTPTGASRINYSLETLKAFCTEAHKWDPDGVSFYLFGASCHAYPDLQPADIDAKLANIKLEPMTMTHLAINAAYAEHKSKGSEQTFLMIFTDGEPADQGAVQKAIVDITNDVKDQGEFRIAFITVGVRSAGLDAWLTLLDDALPGAKYDIVDVKKLEDVDFMAAVAGALND